VKIAKVIAVMLFGPLLGIFAGFVVGVVAMPQDPNFVSNGGHGAPGDGILVIVFTLVGLVVSIPLSAVLAWRLWFRPSAIAEANSN
jgi:hypothetical protein